MGLLDGHRKRQEGLTGAWVEGGREESRSRTEEATIYRQEPEETREGADSSVHAQMAGKPAGPLWEIRTAPFLLIQFTPDRATNRGSATGRRRLGSVPKDNSPPW